MKKISKTFFSDITNQINFLVTFAGIALKLEDVGPIFNPCPFLPSVATDDRKQFQCLNIILENTTKPLFRNSIDAKKRFSFHKYSK